MRRSTSENPEFQDSLRRSTVARGGLGAKAAVSSSAQKALDPSPSSMLPGGVSAPMGAGDQFDYYHMGAASSGLDAHYLFDQGLPVVEIDLSKQ
jgi:hypothetical protein